MITSRASRNSLRFCARALEKDAGFGSNLDAAFLNPSLTSLRGSLRSAAIPSDLQRHEIGPGGEVLHMSSVGLENCKPLESKYDSQIIQPQRRKKVKIEAASSFGTEPWSAMLYSCGKRPAAAQRLLASTLQLPVGALRCSAALHIPGVSVQHVSLPRGLPMDCLVGERGERASEILRGDIVCSPEASVALGAIRPIGSQPTALGLRSVSRRKGRSEWKCEGHRYSVVIRNLDMRQCQSGAVEENIDHITTEGFLNLFELSSFGFAEVRRYEVGAALWTGQWDLAARLLLVMNWGGDLETSPLSKASLAFRAGDLARGIDLLPESGADGLRSLATHLLRGQPALQALQLSMPIPAWSRFLSSVAKFAFNIAAASRLSDFPRRVVVGDLVWDEDAGEARPISSQEVPNYQLTDVVLPLPRRGQPVPECPSRLRIESVLQRLVPGNDADEGAFPRNVNTSMPSVRRLLCVPTDVSHDIVEAEAAPIVDCDLTRLGIDTAKLTPHVDGSRRRGRRSARADDDPAGLALRMRFSLPRSGCAESLIRELLRSNPSAFHKDLSRRDETF